MECSVKKLVEIAREYRYKVEMVTVSRIGKGRAFLSANNPFLKSPYPHHFTSVCATRDYVQKMYEEC